MKKIIILLVALCVAFNANAQFGIMGGLTSSHTSIKGLKDAGALKNLVQNSNQYHIGITYKLPVLGDLLTLQPCLMYNVKGATLGAENSKVDFKTGFLELSLQGQAGLSLLSVVRLYGIVEPYIGYAINNKATATAVGVSADFKTDLKNKLEYGIGAGLGVELFKHFQVSARYFWSLGEVYNIESFNQVFSQVKDATKTKSNGIIISAAILF